MKKNFLTIIFSAVFLTCSFNTFAVDNSFNLNTRMSSNGDNAAVWIAYSSTTFAQLVKAAILPAGGAWTTPTVLDSTFDYIQDAKIAINSLGNAVAVWMVNDSTIGVDVLRASTFSGGTWSSATQISDNSENVNDNFYVNLDDSDNVTVTWSNLNTLTFENYIRSVVTTLGTWTAPVNVSN